MAPALTSVREIERELSSLRAVPGTETPYQRTSVMTHTAWVPEEWVEAAEDVLSGLAERHPSRTVVLFPEPDADDGLDGEVEVDVYPAGEGRQICTETIRIRLKGGRAAAPASVVQPLLLPDLPAFLRWRGEPPWGATELDQLASLADRLIVDSTEWDDLPYAYTKLASLWPDIADVKRIRVTGTAAQAQLLAGWLRSRLGHDVELEHDRADRLEGVELDGEPAPFPPGDPPQPSDVLSDELDRFTRDPVYEAAVRAATA